MGVGVAAGCPPPPQAEARRRAARAMSDVSFRMAGSYGAGDQAGKPSSVGLLVRLVWPDPSAFIT